MKRLYLLLTAISMLFMVGYSNPPPDKNYIDKFENQVLVDVITADVEAISIKGYSTINTEDNSFSIRQKNLNCNVYYDPVIDIHQTFNCNNGNKTNSEIQTNKRYNPSVDPIRFC